MLNTTKLDLDSPRSSFLIWKLHSTRVLKVKRGFALRILIPLVSVSPHITAAHSDKSNHSLPLILVSVTNKCNPLPMPPPPPPPSKWNRHDGVKYCTLIRHSTSFHHPSPTPYLPPQSTRE
ncbi:unnamed protein product [Hymenolepis diminuta]|uniref:Uncharacterized protein n=1 Tax=Hymenolepis diminuta TaxID=6216 RepID=A0A564Z130_HYMDI|nr:unnamed protein product [Hymenolepis diminuta]